MYMLKIFKKLFFFISFIFLFYNTDIFASYESQNNFQKIKEYLKNLSTLEANFIQISSDGDIKRGKIFFKLPGKLRIDYSEPNDLLITSKGFWLTVQDKKLKQTNNYPLDRTPLSLFLNKKFNSKIQIVKNASKKIDFYIPSTNFAKKYLKLKNTVNFNNAINLLIK